MQEDFDDPAPLEAMQLSAVLRALSREIRTARGRNFDDFLAQLLVERITVVRHVSDQVLWRGFDHIEADSRMHQRDLMIIRCVRGDGDWQAVTIDYHHDFCAFTTPRRPNFLTAAVLPRQRGGRFGS